MIIDIHTHLFPAVMRDQRQDWFTGEPAFRLLYQSPKSRMIGARDLIAAMDEQGIDKSVVFGFPWQTQDTFKRHNDYILDAVQRYPDRLVGFCCFDGSHPRAADEAERCLAAGLAGIGELAFYCSDLGSTCRTALDPVMDVALAFDCPVMLHTNEPVGHHYPGKTDNTLAQIYALIKAFPRNRIILAHWGGGLFFFALLKKEVRQVLANVWFDTAASPFLYDRAIYCQALSIIGADKILFGSDFPLLSPGRYFQEMVDAGVPPEALEKFKGGNAAALLGLT